ncbi:hypothetical protein HPB51_025406 [Rhipicephalus microplus]|uniref:Uncharacterized protein n=1 Tax=Rhipicephalus microplus TaxID=6941 RepID=A0A9J6D8L7_RHIMP|nr:hypothetical protein HPB51_025406 [Rhipicephalus microplus]
MTNWSMSLAANRAAAAMSQPSKRNLKKHMDSGTLLAKYHGLAVHEVYKPCKKHQMLTRRQDHVSEAHQLRLKTEQLLARLQEATPQYVVRLRNCTASREQKLIDKNRVDYEVSLPLPRPPLRQRNLPISFRPENSALTHPVETKTQRLTHADKQCSSSETPLPCERGARTARL